MDSEIYIQAQAMNDTLVGWYRYLHQIPEVGLLLPQTVAFVTQALDEMGVPYRRIAGGNGVLAQLGQGPYTLLLRADMDALPISEETGLSYAATNGCMHACGHDMHTTALLGAAKILKARESALKSTVKLLFQPGEEIFNGAKACLEDGVLEAPSVEAAFGLHVASIVPRGVIAYGAVTNASVYGFKITITGKGTHGAMPEKGVDPINVGVHIYQGLQALIARECAPNKEVSLTIGQFSAGTTSNVIPETAVLQGSLRSFDDATRRYLIGRIETVAMQMTAAFGATATLEVLNNLPMVQCDDALNHHLATVFQALSPNFIVRDGFCTTGSEDFSLISERVPSAYFVVGAQTEEGEIVAHHNPKTRFSEKALPIATALFAAAALGE